MAQQTPKGEYDELISALKDGTHSFDGRSVLQWDEFDGPPAGTISVDATANKPAVMHPYGGKRVVAIQYGGKDGGGGGVLREYAFDPDALKEPAKEPDKEPEKESAKELAMAAAEDAADKEAQAADEKADDDAEDAAAMADSMKASSKPPTRK